jgi:hypothetical protein
MVGRDVETNAMYRAPTSFFFTKFTENINGKLAKIIDILQGSLVAFKGEEASIKPF